MSLRSDWMLNPAPENSRASKSNRRFWAGSPLALRSPNSAQYSEDVGGHLEDSREASDDYMIFHDDHRQDRGEALDTGMI